MASKHGFDYKPLERFHSKILCLLDFGFSSRNWEAEYSMFGNVCKLQQSLAGPFSVLLLKVDQLYFVNLQKHSLLSE